MPSTDLHTPRDEANKSEQIEDVRKFKLLLLAMKWSWRLAALGYLAIANMQPEATVAASVRFVTAREGLYWHALLLLIAVLERDALIAWTKFIVKHAIAWYASAVERQRSECKVYSAAHPNLLESGWDRFWRERAEAARIARKRRDEIEFIRANFPGFKPEAVVALKERIVAERLSSTPKVVPVREAVPTTPDSIDGVAVSDLAREIAVLGTVAVEDIKEVGLSHRHAIRVSSTLRERSFVLYSEESKKPLSYERVAYMDKQHGRLVTLNRNLMDASADVRAQLIEGVLRRDMLKQEQPPTPTIYGTPTEFGTAYDAKAAPKVAKVSAH